jgi:hypothetical protein
MVAESGLSVIKGAAAAFLPTGDAGSQIARQGPQPIFLIGEKLADVNAVIKATLPEIGSDPSIGSTQSGHSRGIPTCLPLLIVIHSHRRCKLLEKYVRNFCFKPMRTLGTFQL